jgi:hypothetical protein
MLIEAGFRGRKKSFSVYTLENVYMQVYLDDGSLKHIR